MIPEKGSAASSRSRLVGKNLLSVSAAGMALRVIGALTTLAIARRYSDAEFGVLNYALSLMAMLMGLSSLSVDDILVREIAAKPEQARETVEAGIGFKALLTLLAFVALPLILLLSRQSASVFWATLACCVGMLGGVASPLFAPAKAELRLPWLKAWEVGSGLVSAAVAVLLVWVKAPFILLMLALGVMGRPGFTWGLPFVAYLSAREWRLVRPGWGILRPRQWAPLVRATLPLAANSIAFVLYSRVDQVLMLPLLGAHALSGYAADVRIIEFTGMIPVSIATVLLPLVSREVQEKGQGAPRSYLFAVRHSTVALLPFILLCLFTPQWTIRLCYGAGYAHAEPLLFPLSLSTIFAFWGTLQFPLLVAAGETGMITLGGFIGALSNIVLNLWWMPRFGAAGAAWANLASVALPQLFLALTGTTAGRFVRATVRETALPLSAAAGLALAAWSLPLSREAALFAAIGGYVAVVVAARLIDFKALGSLLGVRLPARPATGAAP